MWIFIVLHADRDQTCSFRAVRILPAGKLKEGCQSVVIVIRKEIGDIPGVHPLR